MAKRNSTGALSRAELSAARRVLTPSLLEAILLIAKLKVSSKKAVEKMSAASDTVKRSLRPRKAGSQ